MAFSALVPEQHEGKWFFKMTTHNLGEKKKGARKSPTEVGLFELCKSEEKRLHHAAHAAGTGSSGSSR